MTVHNHLHVPGSSPDTGDVLVQMMMTAQMAVASCCTMMMTAQMAAAGCCRTMMMAQMVAVGCCVHRLLLAEAVKAIAVDLLFKVPQQPCTTVGCAISKLNQMQTQGQVESEQAQESKHKVVPKPAE